MRGAVFFETLRRSWKTMLYLGGGIAVLAIYYVLMVMDEKMLKQLSGMVENFQWLINALGGGDAAFMTTPEGLLNYVFYSWVVLIIAAYAIIAGLNVTSSEEDRGILDILLSMPIPRWRVVLEKLLAYAVIITGVVALGHVALVLGIQNSPVLRSAVTIGTPARLAECSFNMIPPLLLVLVFTALMATLVRRRSMAATIAAVFVIASFFIEMIGRSVPSADKLRVLSFYSVYDSAGVMKNGLAWGNVIGLLTAAAILLAGALVAFQRRDISV
jgi:ABC-2 type transport system permease protein